LFIVFFTFFFCILLLVVAFISPLSLYIILSSCPQSSHTYYYLLQNICCLLSDYVLVGVCNLYHPQVVENKICNLHQNDYLFVRLSSIRLFLDIFVDVETRWTRMTIIIFRDFSPYLVITYNFFNCLIFFIFIIIRLYINLL